ncbi:hypothetical protein D9M68_984880 [compost metagenome]
MVGTSGSMRLRWREVTASARSLPDWMKGREVAMMSNIIGTVPAITSASAGALPL